jgi:hypothetical protein
MKYATLGIGVVVVAALAWFAFMFLNSSDLASLTGGGGSGVSSVSSSTRTSLKPPRQAPAGYQEYRDEQYRFALFYPSNLSVKTYDEGGGAMTIIFQDIKTVQGFQVYVVPYEASQVSDAQFKRDEPSGVRKNPQNATIDGAAATSFYSTNLTLGETAEVWFVRGGYLFEVTTLKSLDTWLAGIMQTWQFI